MQLQENSLKSKELTAEQRIQLSTQKVAEHREKMQQKIAERLHNINQ